MESFDDFQLRRFKEEKANGQGQYSPTDRREDVPGELRQDLRQETTGTAASGEAAAVTMEDAYVLDCAGQKTRVGDSFSYATRRGSNLQVNLYVLDSIEMSSVKATIIGGPAYERRAKTYDRKRGSYVDSKPRQSNLGCFGKRATRVGGIFG